MIKSAIAEKNDELSGDLEDYINQELLALRYILNLPGIFEDASINQKNAILNEVFKYDLTFKEVCLEHL